MEAAQRNWTLTECHPGGDVFFLPRLFDKSGDGFDSDSVEIWKQLLKKKRGRCPQNRIDGSDLGSALAQNPTTAAGGRSP